MNTHNPVNSAKRNHNNHMQEQWECLKILHQMQLAMNGHIKYSQTKSMKQRTKSIFMSKLKFSRSLHLSIYPIDWTLIGDTMTIENWSSLWQTNFLQPNKMCTRDDLHYDMDIYILTNCFFVRDSQRQTKSCQSIISTLTDPDNGTSQTVYRTLTAKDWPNYLLIYGENT